MPASDRATRPPLFGPEVGNWKLPKSEMSFRVPSLSGALLLSMMSLRQETFFIDCKINKKASNDNNYELLYNEDHMKQDKYYKLFIIKTLVHKESVSKTTCLG